MMCVQMCQCFAAPIALNGLQLAGAFYSAKRFPDFSLLHTFI